ncbi:MAG: GGDEF domain-containing protein, partial [Candidatus Omnitrophota bacterium]
RNKLIDLATKDSLTGLYIRRHFNLILETQVQMVKDRGGNLSLLMIDLDNFKNVNDTYGHKAGDLVLRETAKTLLASCRPLDIVGRYGGEEFIVMLPGADESSASLVAERIRYRVKKSDFKFKNTNYKITVSVGISNYKRDDTPGRLIEKADWALYKAKERGKDGVFSSEFLEEL